MTGEKAAMPTIKELREERGWTQQELARRASLTHQTVSNLENGASVQRSTLVLLAQALGVDPEAISGVTVVNRVLSRRGNES